MVPSAVSAIVCHQIFVASWLSVFRQPFLTKLGVVVHQHEPHCHAQKLGFCLHGEGHREGLYNKKYDGFYSILY